jgi:transposase
MSQKRLSMRKIREVLRLKFELGLNNRQIAASCRVSHVTVGKYLARFSKSGLNWPLPPETDNDEVMRRLFGDTKSPGQASRPLPDLAKMQREMRRKGVTLQLLWQEYREIHPEGYGYTQFCEHYHRFKKRLHPCLRQEYRAGERMFIDYAGQTIPIYDQVTGQITPAELFVAALGASNYTYAEATLSQQLEDWIGSHVRAFEFFGGVTQLIVPDNLKSGVTRACRYDPDLNATYQDLAAHYGTAILPARPGRPRDKAKVESAVLIAERWIIAVLRHRKFFSLAELNAAIRELLEKFNNRRFNKLPGTRTEWFRDLEVPALRPLPTMPYELARWLKAGVNIDYHVQVRGHYYSVPYRLIKEKVEVRLTATTVEFIHRGRRVAAHARSVVVGGFTTIPEHRPKSHRRHLEWTPSRIIAWAGTVGPHCAAVVQWIIESKPHPEQGYRSCLGLLRLTKTYGNERVEAACRRALQFQTCSYRSIKSILAAKLDAQPLSEDEPSTPVIEHENVRGRRYYN